MFHLFGQPQNKNEVTFRRLKVFLILIWLALFAGGMIGHQGSPLLYALFSAVLTVVLLSGVYRQTSYGYLFLVVFFWLGFWLKLTVHNIFRYDYVEPIGLFDGSPAAWDEALWVPIVAGIGILLGRWLYSVVGGGGARQVTADSSRVPGWYGPARRGIWAFLMVATVGLAALNRVYGIQQSGLASQTILVWPLNGVIYWLLSTGLSMGVATLIWWDICLRRDISLSIYAIFGEAFLSTMSLLSRGLFVFHIVPPLLAVYVNKRHLIWKAQRKFFFIAMILGIFFIVSLSIVSTLRSYLYQPNQDFRSTTQNQITRLQILQALIPAAEQRIVIEGIARIEVLQAKIPAVEQLIVLKDMPHDKRLLEIERLGLNQNVPIEKQYQEFIQEKTRLELELAERKRVATVAKSPREVNHWILDKNATIEHQLQALVLEKAELEQSLGERKAQAAAAMGSWLGKSGLLLNEFGYQMTGGLGSRVFALGVDRWIGMEGVMAISSYPQKSNGLFLAALTERSGIGKVTMYQKICQSIYQTADTTKYQFASLPGAAAFFYYTGSLWAVFLGMFLLTLMAVYGEYLVHYLTGNVLLCALVGMNAANAIAQLGVVPRQLLIHFGMLFGAVAIIWLLQSKNLSAIFHQFFHRKILR